MKFLRRLIEMAAPANTQALTTEDLSADVVEAIGEPIDDSAARQQQAYEDSRRAERQRLTAILSSPEAEGRTRLATYLATETELTPAEAAKILAASDRRATANAPKDAHGKPSAKEQNAAQCADFFSRHRAENPQLWEPPPPMSVGETIDRMNRSYDAVTGKKQS